MPFACLMHSRLKARDSGVEYAGQRPSLVDSATGGIVPVELFVAVLGASNYVYASTPSRSPSAGFSRGCGTRPSSPWPR